MKRMRLRAGAVGYYDISLDGETLTYYDNKWEKYMTTNYIIIVDVAEKRKEIPPELYAKAPWFDCIPTNWDSRFWYWARLVEVIEKATDEVSPCETGIESWYLFQEKHLSDGGLSVGDKALKVREAWKTFECKLDSTLRRNIYYAGADWCVAVRSECKKKNEDYSGCDYCPCLRMHPSTNMFHCLMDYLKSNLMMPDANISTTKLYEILR